jgi:hypothetical protein
VQINKSRILDAARWRPPQVIRRIEVDDGKGGKRIEEVVARLPSQRHEMMLNPAGFVVPVVLGCANQVAEEHVTPYAQQIRARKMALGFLPWGRCPVAMVGAQQIPARLLRDKSLHSADACKGGGFGPENPCPHALAEQKFRTDAHVAKDRSKANAYKAEAERDREQRDRHHEDLLRSQQDLLAAIAGKQPPKRKGDGEG